MDNFHFKLPIEYYFGRGQELEVGRIIRELKKFRVLIVAGYAHARKSGLIERIQSYIKEENISSFVYEGIASNPRSHHVHAVVDIIKSEKIDFILALGGGSVIDVVKAASIAVYLDNKDFFQHFFIEQAQAHKGLDFGVILTLSGSGSESSDVAVIDECIDDEVRKCSYHSKFFQPRFAILNPELGNDLDPYYECCGIVDTMTHIMERYFTNTHDVAVSDRLAEGLMLSLIETAPRILNDSHDYEARANLMWIAAMAQNNICAVGRQSDFASHHLEHQLSARFGIAHGAGMAVIFPAWMEYTLSHDVMRFCQFATRVFGIAMDFDDPRYTAKEGIRALRLFFKSLNMPLSFKDIGLSKNDINDLLNLLELHHDSHGHFMVLDRSDCEAIYNIAASYDSESDF